MENYHLIKEDNSWKLKKQGSDRASKVFKDMNKTQAVKASANHLKQSGGSLKIHKVNGRIQEERTYPRKNDPSSSKG